MQNSMGLLVVRQRRAPCNKLGQVPTSASESKKSTVLVSMGVISLALCCFKCKKSCAVYPQVGQLCISTISRALSYNNGKSPVLCSVVSSSAVLSRMTAKSRVFDFPMFPLRAKQTRPFTAPPQHSAYHTRQHETFLRVWVFAIQHGTLSSSDSCPQRNHAKSEGCDRDFDFLCSDRFVVKHTLLVKCSFF
jgi:hypothetical protein